jgi:hypothetical protein
VSSYDPHDPKSQDRAREDKQIKARSVQLDEEADLKWLMGSKRGRRIVWRLLDDSGVFRLSFNTNAMQMAFAEGNRNFGNRTLAMIHSLCPELYPVMVKEHAYDRSTVDGPDRNSN